MKHIVYAFLLAVVLYIIVFTTIEYRRTRNGPWEVRFTRSATGAPAMVINQPRLGITNVHLLFAGAHSSTDTNGPTLLFREARQVPYSVPFGTCVFVDTTVLPGTVTLELFDHQVELLPRVLIIDRQEHAWRPHLTISLPPAKPASEQAR